MLQVIFTFCIGIINIIMQNWAISAKNQFAVHELREFDNAHQNPSGTVHGDEICQGCFLPKISSSACASQADERSGATYAAPLLFCDCLFALICAEEEGDNLRTRAGIVRHELAAVALYDFLSKRPVHRGKRVARNGIGVREAGHQLLQGDRLGRSVAEQKRDGLSAGAFAVGRECVLRCTGGDALAERPADGLGVVAAFGCESIVETEKKMTKGARREIVRCEQTDRTLLRDLPSQ